MAQRKSRTDSRRSRSKSLDRLNTSFSAASRKRHSSGPATYMSMSVLQSDELTQRKQNFRLGRLHYILPRTGHLHVINRASHYHNITADIQAEDLREIVTKGEVEW